MAINRRDFIKSSSVLAAGMATVPMFANSSLGHLSANDTINVALIGCRRGWSVLLKFFSHKNVRCLALCDVKQDLLAEKAAYIAEKYGKKPDLYTDYRRVLERKEIDIVIIATPDHWHCLQFVDSCRAGKDIYLEKPIANSIAESEIMVDVAKKSNVIVQVGQQQRSDTLWIEAMDYLKSGTLGRIGRIHAWANFSYGAMRPPVPDSPAPETLDYDMWLGPAPKMPFNQRRFGWRMFWDYGGGLMTDWGVHLLDMGLWAMDIKTTPLQTLAAGGKFLHPEGAHETFDTLNITYQFKDFVMTWENNGGVDTGPYGKNYGVLFRGTNGSLVADRQSWKIYPEGEKIPVVEVASDQRDLQNHVDNFLHCVKNRNPETACTIENGSLCAKYAHLGNIGARMGGGALIYDEQTRKFNIAEADKYLKPDYRKPWLFPTESSAVL